MAVPRRSGVRGSVVRGESGKGTKSSRPEPLAEPEDVADPALPRSVVDFALQRRSSLHTFSTVAPLAVSSAMPTPTCSGRPNSTVSQRPCRARYAGIWALSRSLMYTAMSSGHTPAESGKVAT